MHACVDLIPQIFLFPSTGHENTCLVRRPIWPEKHALLIRCWRRSTTPDTATACRSDPSPAGGARHSHGIHGAPSSTVNRQFGIGHPLHPAAGLPTSRGGGGASTISSAAPPLISAAMSLLLDLLRRCILRCDFPSVVMPQSSNSDVQVAPRLPTLVRSGRVTISPSRPADPVRMSD